MSVSVQVNMRCDVCGNENDTAYWTIGEARAEARIDGWRQRKINGKWIDVCIDCLEREASSQGTAVSV